MAPDLHRLFDKSIDMSIHSLRLTSVQLVSRSGTRRPVFGCSYDKVRQRAFGKSAPSPQFLSSGANRLKCWLIFLINSTTDKDLFQANAPGVLVDGDSKSCSLTPEQRPLRGWSLPAQSWPLLVKARAVLGNARRDDLVRARP